MTLDPQVSSYLRKVNAFGQVDYATLTPEQARKTHRSSYVFAGEPEHVGAVEQHVAPGPHGDVPVRVYRPVSDDLVPALVFFHGGGWVVGDTDAADVSLRALCNRSSCAIASVDYRLSPEHKFPVPLDDCFAATEWVASSGAELGVDATRLAVGGDSAGGNLAAAVTLLARERGGPAVAFQMLIYPVTNHDFDTESYVTNAEGYGLTRAGMQWYWECYLADPADAASPLASPLRAGDLSGLPPALVVTAEYDPLRDEGKAYAARLREAGVAVTLSRYEGHIHGFFRLGGVIDATHDLVDECARELRKALM
ncbi:MAG TPA: alpha/beta hydrolase [Actinomycetota bacterium]|nr:alpha/beta hydrolase [Actinomycetota bacterium]